MKISAYYALHYGREWLEWSLRSVRPFVDDLYILYTDHPSHGHDTQSRCPDTKEELFYIAEPFSPIWIDLPASIKDEGSYRQYAVDRLWQDGADIILAPDADEIWDADELSELIDCANTLPFKRIGTGVKGHFWKSVNWICCDPCVPIRLLKKDGILEVGYLSDLGFWHFGYAQSLVTVLYKSRIHGHKSEFRQEWPKLFHDWTPQTQNDPLFRCGVHPTNGCDADGRPFWSPRQFDRQKIAHLIGDHPYFNDNLI